MDNPPTNSPKTNIVIVDDTPANLRLLAGMLNQHGFEVRPIPNGKLALNAIKISPPDLILLDINMPTPNGYEVCQALKADKKTADIPIIFISALDEVMDKVMAFSIGGLDYITKPFHIEEVIARVNTHLTLLNLRKQLEKANTDLSSTNMALHNSNADLNAFSRTVAHDLKNPLGLMVGYTDYLLGSGPEMTYKDIVDTLQIIKNTSQKMSSIIDELLLLAGVNKQNVQSKRLNMADIVALAQNRLTFLIEQYQGEISVPDEWPDALGYAAWVEEVWANYISNGLKYGGQPSHLQLGATLQADGLIRFWVKDNGPGITPAAQASLFTEFTRLDDTRAQGHGLGLSIVQRIINKLGGQVGVESDVGHGSTFFFTLPSTTTQLD